MELTAVTLRTASRSPIGVGGFQEAGVSLSFAVRGEELEAVMPEAAAALDRAFQALWKRLDDEPESP